MKKLFESVQDFLSTINQNIRSFITSIKNLFYWFPIIWRDRQYDHTYIVDILKHKLKKVKKYNQHKIKDWEYELPDDPKDISRHHPVIVCQRIDTILKLMEHIYENDKYFNDYNNNLEKLYGKSKLEFVKIGEDNPLKGFEDYKDIYNLVEFWERDYTPEQIKEIEKHQGELIKESAKKENKAHDLIWKMIGHNIRYWWD